MNIYFTILAILTCVDHWNVGKGKCLALIEWKSRITFTTFQDNAQHIVFLHGYKMLQSTYFSILHHFDEIYRGRIVNSILIFSFNCWSFFLERYSCQIYLSLYMCPLATKRKYHRKSLEVIKNLLEPLRV